MVIKKKSQAFQERLRALFALSANKKKSGKGECLSVNEMAALIDGGLSSRKRNSLFMHMDACPSCYAEWLAAAAEVSENKNTDNIRNGTFTKNRFFLKHHLAFKSALAVAASLILFILFTIYHQPSFAKLINAQYQMVLDMKLSLNDSGLPSDKDADSGRSIFQFYGFAGASGIQPSPFALSFISGFQTGRAILMNNAGLSKKNEAPENDYFWAGRWFALLSTVCESDCQIPDRYWEMQQENTRFFKNIFNRHAGEESEAVILARSIDRIGTEIVQKRDRTCRLIKWELDFILEGLNQTL